MINAGDIQNSVFVLGSGSSEQIFRTFEAPPQEFQFVTTVLSGANGLRDFFVTESITEDFLDFDNLVLTSGNFVEVVTNESFVENSGLLEFATTEFVEGLFELVVTNPSGILEPTRFAFDTSNLITGESLQVLLEEVQTDNSIIDFVTSEIVDGLLAPVFVDVSGVVVVGDVDLDLAFEFQQILATGLLSMANLFYEELPSLARIQDAFAVILQSTTRFLKGFDVELPSRANIAFRNFETLNSRASFRSRPLGVDRRTYIKPAALWELVNGAEEVDLLTGGYTQLIGLAKDGQDIIMTEFPTGVMWRVAPNLEVYDILGRYGALAGVDTYLPIGNEPTYITTTPVTDGSVVRVSSNQVGTILDNLGFFPYWVRQIGNTPELIFSDPQNFRFVRYNPITREQTVVIQGTPAGTEGGFSSIGLPFQFDLIGNDIYWVDASTKNRVFKGNIVTGDFAPIIDENEQMFRPVGIAVDVANEIIYIATPLTQDDVNGMGDGKGAIWQANIDGSQLRIRYEEGLLVQPNSLLMDGNRLLIVDTGQGFNYQSAVISIPNGDAGALGSIPSPQGLPLDDPERFDLEEKIAAIEQLEEIIEIIPGYKWTNDPDNLFGVLEFNFGDGVEPGAGGGELASIEELFAEIEAFNDYLQSLRDELQPLLDDAAAALAQFASDPRDIDESVEIEEDPIDEDVDDTLDFNFVDLVTIDLETFIEAGRQARASGLLSQLLRATLSGGQDGYNYSPQRRLIYEQDTVRRRIIVERPLFFARRRRRKERPHGLIDVGIIDRTGRAVYSYQAPPFKYAIVRQVSFCCWDAFPYVSEVQMYKKAGLFYAPPPQNATSAEVREIFRSDVDDGTPADRLIAPTIIGLTESIFFQDIIVLNPLDRFYVSMWGSWTTADIFIQEIPTTYSDATIQYAIDNNVFDVNILDVIEENLS